MVEINTNMLATTVYSHLRNAESASMTAMERLSSGKRINSAMDDAAGLSISNRLNVLTSSIQKALGNVSDGLSMGFAAEAGMREIDGYLTRTRELLTQAANSTLSSNAVSSIFNEIEQMMGGIAETIAVTKFNGVDLLGNRSTLSASTLGAYQFIDDSGSFSYTPVETVTYDTTRLTTDSLSVSQIREIDTPSSTSLYQSSVSASPNTSSYTTMADVDPQWDSSGNLYFQSNREGGSNVWYQSTSATSANITEVSGTPSYVTTITSLSPSDTGTRYGIRVDSSGDVQLYDSSRTYLGWYDIWPGRDVGGDVAFSTQILTDANGDKLIDLAYSNGWDIYVNRYNLTDGTYVSNRLVTNTTADSGANVLSDSDTNRSISVGFTLEASDLYPDSTLSSGDAAFRILKVYSQSGSSRWLARGTDYDMAVGSSTVTFTNTGIMGAESSDTDSGYYVVYRSASVHNSDGYADNDGGDAYADRTVFASIPSGVDLYGMRPTDSGPMSLKITVGSSVVSRSDLLSAKPTSSNTNGVYVDLVNRTVEMYGSWRPSYGETSTVQFWAIDNDGDYDSNAGDTSVLNDGTVTFQNNAWKSVDTYNLASTATVTDDPIRVYLYRNGTKTSISYDANNGYTFDSISGEITLHGASRPDAVTDSRILVEWFDDLSNSDAKDSLNTYSLELSSAPEIYNLLTPSTDVQPRSLSVFVDNVEIENDPVNGYSYDSINNIIILNGNSRPTADTDLVEVYYMQAANTTLGADGVIYLDVSSLSNDYVYALSNSGPQALKVEVNGSLISYDASQTDGFTYDAANNRIEIYGNSRPAVGDTNTTTVRIGITNVVADQTSDISSGLISSGFTVQLDSSPQGYGVEADGSPSSGVSTTLQVIGSAYDGSTNLVDIPYSSTDGYTYDASTNKITLHGIYQPSLVYSDSTASSNNTLTDFTAYTISGDDLEIPIPSGAELNRVLKSTNGGVTWSSVGLASENGGNGYVVSNGVVSLMGTAKPNAESLNSSGSYKLKLETFSPPSPLTLTATTPSYLPDEVLEWLPHLANGVDEDSIEVFIYQSSATIDAQIEAGTETISAIDSSAYSFDGTTLTLDWDSVSISGSPFTVKARYQEYTPSSPQANMFRVQAGTSSDDAITYTIQAFENILTDIYQAPAPTQSSISLWMERLEAAESFLMNESVKVGAVQNRLSYAEDNLLVQYENLSAANSRILDADYAVETANLARAQILAKAGYAMMAQAKSINADLVQRLLK